MADNRTLHIPSKLRQLPATWKWERLDDLCRGVIDCPHSTPQLVSNSQYFVVRTQDILAGVLRLEEVAQVSKETYHERIARGEPQFGDLLYSREGTYFGIAAEVPENTKVCLGQRMMLIQPKHDLIDFRFLRFWLNSPIMSAHIHGFRDGTVAERLNLPIVRGLPVAVPSLPEQRAIASILGSLDDKIELNRKMNATLEETARTIFQSWFVDFDPVHAKAAGRAPAGLDAETAALFPDSFEEIGRRMVPQGWEVGRIGDSVSVVGGSTPSTKEVAYWDAGDIHWTTPKDLSSLSSPILLDTDRYITELGLQQIGSGLLPEGTVLLSSRAPIGYLAIAMIPTAINQGFIAMVCDQELPNYYVLLWAETNLDLIKSRANGTTFLEISKSNFRSIEILLPSQQVLEAFVSIVRPIYDLVRKNLEQSHTLTHLRDTLLPKLLSGDLRVGS